MKVGQVALAQGRVLTADPAVVVVQILLVTLELIQSQVQVD
jgi:hypothetical protein